MTAHSCYEGIAVVLPFASEENINSDTPSVFGSICEVAVSLIAKDSKCPFSLVLIVFSLVMNCYIFLGKGDNLLSPLLCCCV